MSQLGKDFWPKSVAHLNQPYHLDDNVVIAQISDRPVTDYEGFVQLHTALIPLDEVDEVVNTPGGIGWKVESWGPKPIVSPIVKTQKIAGLRELSILSGNTLRLGFGSQGLDGPVGGCRSSHSG